MLPRKKIRREQTKHKDQQEKKSTKKANKIVYLAKKSALNVSFQGQ